MSTLALQTTFGTSVAARHSLIPLVFEGRPPTSLLCWVGVLTFGLAAHTAVFLMAGHLRRSAPPPPTMEVVLTPPPPPAPKTAQPPPVPSKPETPPPKAAAMPRARAGRVIAAAPEAPGAAGADDIVTGEAETYAGGSTVSSGTASEPVEAPPPPPPPPPPAPKVDLIALTRAYLGRIRDALVREKRYPLAAQRIGLEGTVIISFVIDASGAFARVAVVSSSGNDLLDQAAVDTVKALSRKIPRPREIGTLELPLRTAIRFEIAR